MGLDARSRDAQNIPWVVVLMGTVTPCPLLTDA